jgi:hypothetical protein
MYYSTVFDAELLVNASIDLATHPPINPSFHPFEYAGCVCVRVRVRVCVCARARVYFTNAWALTTLDTLPPYQIIQCVCVCVGGWVGVSVCACVCVCVCVRVYNRRQHERGGREKRRNREGER